ncbi:MAG TPA: efflux RND transporter periplasmic adaptor subunit [Patescibacteria group bacterium]|nr:efflux RND transporter periplasmic adaptor subunit [Patescibacteria group bacterium]
MKKLFQSLVAILVIGALTYAAIHFTEGVQQERQRRRGAGADGAVPVVATQARLADVPVWLEGVGTAKARNTVTVRAQVEGKILSIDFKEGQDVKKGDVLAHIDPVTYQAQYDQAVAKKALDEALLANSKRDLDRYTKVGTLAISQQQIDTQRALVAQQEAQVKSDQAAISNVHAILGYTNVVAPIDGRTGLRQIDVGNIVRTSDTPIVTLTEIRPISVMFTLPQQQLPEINKARVGKELHVEALETGHKTVLDTGELQVIDNQVDQTTGTIRLKADFPNTDLQLWPGQFVNVRLLLKTLEQVVVVPTSAMQRGPDGTFVYVVGDANKVGMRPVTLAQQDDANAVISQGLTAADLVVTAGFARLKDGAEVKVAPPGPAPGAAATPGEPQADASGLTPASDTASIVPATVPPPAASTSGQGRHKRGDGTHRGQRKDASAAPGSTPGAAPSTTP